MDWVHLILNVAGLLLWLGWRSQSLGPAPRPLSGHLVATLRRTASAPSARWWFLGGLLLLILLRAGVYYYLGDHARWAPSLSLGPVTLAFRCDRFGRMFGFSAASFGLWLVKFYSGLLLLSVVNNRLEGDPLHQTIRRHLGRLARWPALVRLLLPGLLMGSLWLGLGPWLARLGWHPARPFSITLQQALLVGTAAFLAWEYLLVLLFAIHMVGAYVYLGSAPVWNYASNTARKLLRGLGWMRLRSGVADFAPVAGILLVLLAGEYVSRWLPVLYRRLPLW